MWYDINSCSFSASLRIQAGLAPRLLRRFDLFLGQGLLFISARLRIVVFNLDTVLEFLSLHILQLLGLYNVLQATFVSELLEFGQ